MKAHDEIAHFAEVPLEVEVELDRKIMPLSAILDLKQGSVIKMTRSVGENMSILVGGVLIGYGEIVIIEDLMGIRITDFHEQE
jgi:flagellar motor switch protein FliN/FliY